LERRNFGSIPTLVVMNDVNDMLHGTPLTGKRNKGDTRTITMSGGNTIEINEWRNTIEI